MTTYDDTRSSDGGTGKDREAEVRMMERDLEWPRQVLPLKRRTVDGYRYDCAFLVWGGGPVLYHGNIWDSKLMVADLDRTIYSDYGAIYDDGWRVD
jgi:hypothetical protein